VDGTAVVDGTRVTSGSVVPLDADGEVIGGVVACVVAGAVVVGAVGETVGVVSLPAPPQAAVITNTSNTAERIITTPSNSVVPRRPRSREGVIDRSTPRHDAPHVTANLASATRNRRIIHGQIIDRTSSTERIVS
jgi:hypothetical protein